MVMMPTDTIGSLVVNAWSFRALIDVWGSVTRTKDSRAKRM